MMRSPAGPAAVTPTEIGQSKLPLRSRCASSIRQPRGNAACASAWPPEASHAVWSSSSPARGASAEAVLPDGDAASALRVGTSAGTATLGPQPSPAPSSSAASFTDPVASGPHATPSSRTPQPRQNRTGTPATRGCCAPHAGQNLKSLIPYTPHFIGCS